MKAALALGGWLLSYWWILAILLAIGAGAGFFAMGRAFLDVLREILRFLRSPFGQVALLLGALWLSASAGYDRRSEECAIELRDFKSGLERAAAAERERQIKAASDIASDDTLQAAFDAIRGKNDEDAIHATPVAPARALSRAAAGRVRDVGR